MGLIKLFIIAAVIIAGIFFIGTIGDDSASTGSIALENSNTDITAKGHGGVELVISPTDKKNIDGIVTLTLNDVPSGTKSVGFAISGNGMDLTETGPNIGIDTDGSDTWSFMLDTKRYDNGLYEISGLAFSQADGSGSPLGAATAQVVINN